MIDALTDAGARVIGYDVTFSEASNPEEDQALADAIAQSGRVVLADESGVNPLPMFLQAAGSRVGNAGVQTDADGVVRTIIAWDSLANATACQCASDHGRRIPFVGPPGSFATVSFSDVLDTTVPASTFQDKIVFVGATAPDLHDAYLTPTSGAALMSGVEIHANAAQAILENRALTTFPRSQRAILLLALAAVLIILSLVLRLRYLVFATIGLLVAYLLAALAFASNDILLSIVAPVLLILGLGGTDVAFRYAQEKLRRRFIHQAFAHYLSPHVINQLVQGEHKLELGGVKKELTILFSDIRGFTTLSEKTPPEKLVPFLNEYLTAMTDVVLKTDGTVDKYIGDAIMAFWGAPLPQDDHAIRAATAAINMKKRLQELQKEWQRDGKPVISIGIGINTGEVLVGNMGSKQRFDYTVIGDAVNLAARLESQTKEAGEMIIVSEATKNKLADRFTVHDLGEVIVKGKVQPVHIFGLIGFSSTSSSTSSTTPETT
jgi:adenylate cyclase